MRRVLSTDFGIWPMLKHLERASDHMVASSDYWAQLANYLLLYDQLVIPTGNLQILPVLRIMLGEAAFDEIIRTKGIVLARFDQWFGYAGNGAGLVFFKIKDGPDRPPNIPNLGTPSSNRWTKQLLTFYRSQTLPPRLDADQRLQTSCWTTLSSFQLKPLPTD